MIKTIIEVEIDNIDVDWRYYGFDFKITVDGVIVKEESYENDHAWGADQKNFIEHLEEGGAMRTALEQL